MIYNSNSPKETQNIAKAFARELSAGDVVCLNGDLGAGKTAFVSGLVKAFSVKDSISSPTFTIVNCYDGTIPVYHFDVYRINDSDEMFDLGFEEYLYGNGITIIEWSENICDILPDNRYEVLITKDYEKHEDYRRIEINKL